MMEHGRCRNGVRWSEGDFRPSFEGKMPRMSNQFICKRAKRRQLRILNSFLLVAIIVQHFLLKHGLALQEL